MLLGLGAAIAVVILAARIDLGVQGTTADGRIDWRVGLTPGVPAEVVQIVEATARALEPTISRSAASMPRDRQPRGGGTGDASGGSGPDPRGRGAIPRMPDAAPGLGHNRSLELESPKREIKSSAAALPPASPEEEPPTADNLAKPMLRPEPAEPLAGLPALLSNEFASIRDKRHVARDTAMEAAMRLFELLNRDEFRDPAPWEAKRKGATSTLLPPVECATGVLVERGDGGGLHFRCAVRLQLPGRIRVAALQEVSTFFDEKVGRFFSFRQVGPLVLTPGASSGRGWKGPKIPFAPGSSVGLPDSRLGAVGLLMVANEEIGPKPGVFAVTAGHCLTDRDGHPVLDGICFSPAPLPDRDRGARGVVDEVEMFDDYIAKMALDTAAGTDLGLVRISDPGDVPKEEARRAFGGSRLLDSIVPPEDLDRGNRVLKGSAKSGNQKGKVEAVGVTATLRDEISGRTLLGRNLVEVVLDNPRAAILPGDSGSLIALDSEGFRPLAVVSAGSDVSKLNGHDKPSLAVAYGTPLAHSPALARMKVL